MCQRKAHLVRGIKPGENRVRALDIYADARGIGAEVPQSDRVTGGGDVGLIDRLVGLGLNRNADGGVMGQHAVDGLDEILGRALAVLGFAHVGAFAGQPEHDQLGVQRMGNVDGPQTALDGVGAAGRIVGGVAAVDRARVFPEPGGHEFGDQPFAVQHTLHLFGLFRERGGVEVIQVGHGVVIVKLDAIEAQRFEQLQLLSE